MQSKSSHRLDECLELSMMLSLATANKITFIHAIFTLKKYILSILEFLNFLLQLECQKTNKNHNLDLPERMQK